MLPRIPVEGRVVADPDLRYSPSGTAVASFRFVASDRKKNEQDEWVDDGTLWMKITCFKAMAENVAEQLKKGDLVMVTGKIKTEEWEQDGVKRQALVMLADSIYKSPMMFGARKAAAPAQTDGGWTAPGTQDDSPPF